MEKVGVSKTRGIGLGVTCIQGEPLEHGHNGLEESGKAGNRISGRLANGHSLDTSSVARQYITSTWKCGGGVEEDIERDLPGTREA